VTSPALTSFVGRDSELAALVPLLSEARLLTLAGPGGIGKTRLALALSERVTHLFDGRVWFVTVATLAEPHLVPQAVASALGVGDASDRALLDAIVDTIGSSRGLLVLDNCEHLVDSCAGVAELLLRNCPPTAHPGHNPPITGRTRRVCLARPFAEPASRGCIPGLYARVRGSATTR
jgi:hypothetical protein